MRQPVAPGLSGRVWPVHLKPLPDELLSSWVVRLSAAHGLKLRTFTALAWPGRGVWNRDIDKFAPDEVLQVLAERTATPVGRVAKTCLADFEGRLYETHNPNGYTTWILAMGVYHQLRLRGGLQFCPLCLDCDPVPYFRRAWRLACTTVCTTHGVPLLDRCPTCDAPPQIHRGEMGERRRRVPRPLTCCTSCGRDLRAGAASLQPAPPDHVRLQAHLDHVLEQGWARLPDRWVYSHLYFAVLRQLVRVMATGKAAARFRRVAASSLDLVCPDMSEHAGRPQVELLGTEERGALLPLAGALLEDWPGRFVNVCQKARVWSSDLLRDMRSIPHWYGDIVREHLHRVSPAPSTLDTEWCRANNTGIFGGPFYAPKSDRRRESRTDPLTAGTDSDTSVTRRGGSAPRRAAEQ